MKMAFEILSGSGLTLLIIVVVGAYIWFWLVNMKGAANFTANAVMGIGKVLMFSIVGLVKLLMIIFTAIYALFSKLFSKRR